MLVFIIKAMVLAFAALCGAMAAYAAFYIVDPKSTQEVEDEINKILREWWSK